MDAAGLNVELYPGRPPAPANAIEVDVGVALPVAFSGLRRILQRLREEAPAAIARAAESRPAEWNRLFPGAMQGAPDLSDLAVTPSERRLHRESEQTFRILNLAARAILDALQATGRPLVLRNAGETDLVSLRGLMRAVEWARLDGAPYRLLFGEWGSRRRLSPARFEARHRAYLDSLRERMRATLREGEAPSGAAERPLDPILDLEGSYLAGAVDGQRTPEERIASAVLAIRACFFTTNHEGALLAAEHGLKALEQVGAGVDRAAVVRTWESLDDVAFATPVIEVDRSSLGDVEELRALFHRQIGVVHAFTGEFARALDSFGDALACGISPERLAELRMYRALTWIKRLGNHEKARVEIEAGLQALGGRREPVAALQEGWLRNVYALTYFQEKKLGTAMEQERIAVQCMQGLTDPSAMHLMTNLISNISVLQEAGKESAMALATWRTFEAVSGTWGTNFAKHFTYRRAGLHLKAGQRDEAVASYSAAYELAGSLGDAFHRQSIAGELGRLSLDEGKHEEAARWFERSEEAARAIGDPFRVAEALAGLTLARRGTDFSEAARCVGHSTTYPAETKKLAAALASGSASEVQAVLPAPRTKLNRPFDLVGLY